MQRTKKPLPIPAAWNSAFTELPQQRSAKALGFRSLGRSRAASRAVCVRLASVWLTLWTFFATTSLFFRAYAMLSDVHVSRYQPTFVFDEKEQNFVANGWLQAEFDWRDDGDVVRDDDGRLAAWDRQSGCTTPSNASVWTTSK